MKILHLISSIGFFGAENVALMLAREHRAAGHSVCIGLLCNTHNPHLELKAISEREEIPVQIFTCRGRFDPKTIAHIKRFLNSGKMDIVHSHGYKSTFYAFLGSRGSGIKRIATCHTWYSVNTMMRLYEYIEKMILRYYDGIAVVSSALKDDLMRNIRVPEKIRLIHNGIDTERFDVPVDIIALRGALGIADGYPVIGTVARLDTDKGHRFLLAAVKKLAGSLPSIKCLIVGDGSLRADLEKLTDDTGLREHVIFTGIRDNVPEILKTLDIFVLPSLKEGLPIALLEAMAAKRPVVVTSVGAVPSVIENGKTGLLVPPGDAEMLAGTLLRLLSDKDTANRLAEEGFKRVQKDFSVSRMAADYIDLYQQTLKTG